MRNGMAEEAQGPRQQLALLGLQVGPFRRPAAGVAQVLGARLAPPDVEEQHVLRLGVVQQERLQGAKRLRRARPVQVEALAVGQPAGAANSSYRLRLACRAEFDTLLALEIVDFSFFACNPVEACLRFICLNTLNIPTCRIHATKPRTCV
jgi:hypothetical protein